MTTSFWDTLPRPFFCLAPLADVTDPPFREVIAKRGKPDVMWTEFVSADGLFRGGYDALVRHLAYGEGERPLIAQFFSRDPELMAKATLLAIELGYDGVDVNMGCPDRNVCKQGAGAAIIKEPERAKDIIRAMQEASATSERPIPVSVKTRIGFDTNELETWLPHLLEVRPAAITLHARTKKEMSKVPAHWDQIARAVEIRDSLQPSADSSQQKTLIIGNGDAVSLDDARAKAEASGCDGVMLGRAIFGNPWLFASLADANSPERSRGTGIIDHPRPPLAERLDALKEHITLFEGYAEKRVSFAVMKKHFKSYVAGEDGDKTLVASLMETKTPEEARKVIDVKLGLL